MDSPGRNDGEAWNECGASNMKKEEEDTSGGKVVMVTYAERCILFTHLRSPVEGDQEGRGQSTKGPHRRIKNRKKITITVGHLRPNIQAPVWTKD